MLDIQQNITSKNPFKICFVCLGNICRSPTAEGVFQHLVNEQKLQSFFEVDSAGTSAYHEGDDANSNAQKVANEHDVRLHSKSRQLKPFDLEYFDLIVAMDMENFSNIKQLDGAGQHEKKVVMLRAYDPQPDGQEVPDPYFGGMRGFRNVFEIVHRSCENLLDILEPNIKK